MDSQPSQRRPRLLIVTALFAPSKLIGARRPDRMAAHLSRLGWDVSVLTLRPEQMGPVDPAIRPPDGVEIVRTRVLRPGDVIRSWASLAAPLARRLKGSAAGPRDRHGSGHGTSAAPGPATSASGSGADAASGRGRSAASGPGGGVSAASAPAHEAGILARLEHGFWRWLARREFPDPIRAWRLTAPRAMRGRRFDVVLATLPPYTPAFVAARVARRSGARLVLDYRDPWTEAPRVDWGAGWHEALRERHRRAEDACLREADLAIGVSPTICRWIAGRTDTPVELVTNSYEPEGPAPGACASAEPGLARSARLVYAGSLAYGRNLDPVLAAIARLAPRDGGEQVSLDVAGPSGAAFLASAARMGVSSRVRDLGSLPAAAANALLSGALAGIVLVSTGYEYNVPAKMFDVVAAGRPVLLIGPSAGDAAEMVRRHRLGWCHEAGDVEGIAASLREALAGRAPRPDGLEALQTGPVMARLDRALRALL